MMMTSKIKTTAEGGVNAENQKVQSLNIVYFEIWDAGYLGFSKSNVLTMSLFLMLQMYCQDIGEMQAKFSVKMADI